MPSPQRSYPIGGARGGDNTVGLIRAPGLHVPHYDHRRRRQEPGECSPRTVRRRARWTGKQATPPGTLSFPRLDEGLRAVSYGVLVSYPNVVGGYFKADQVVGESFPRTPSPGSELKQTEIERPQVLAAIADSRRTGQVACGSLCWGRGAGVGEREVGCYRMLTGVDSAHSSAPIAAEPRRWAA